jgi:hypothetical protein
VERLFIKLLIRSVSLVGALCLFGGVALAQEPVPPAPAENAVKAKPAFKRIRPGSLLIRKGKAVAEKDLRGDFGRRRDFEMLLHFSRLAELDVIESVAGKLGDSSASGRAERLRRREKARHREVLARLRSVSLYKYSVGVP